MATVTWPDHDVVEVEIDDHEIDDGENTRRTQFADGYVQQKRLATRGLKIRRCNVVVPMNKVAEFREWVATNGFSWFDFVDPEDKVSRECRIQGGTIPLRRVAGQLLSNGQPFYRGLAILEGY